MQINPNLRELRQLSKALQHLGDASSVWAGGRARRAGEGWRWRAGGLEGWRAGGLQSVWRAGKR